MELRLPNSAQFCGISQPSKAKCHQRHSFPALNLGKSNLVKHTASYHPHPELGHRFCGVGPLPEPSGSEDTSFGEQRAQQHGAPVFLGR